MCLLSDYWSNRCYAVIIFSTSHLNLQKKLYQIYIRNYIYLYKIWNSKVTSRNWTQSLVRVFRKPIPQKNSCETVFLSWIVVSVHYHNTNLFLYRVTCMMNLLTATQPLSSPLSQYPTDALSNYTDYNLTQLRKMILVCLFGSEESFVLENWITPVVCEGIMLRVTLKYYNIP